MPKRYMTFGKTGGISMAYELVTALWNACIENKPETGGAD
jgi:hypothetical protein